MKTLARIVMVLTMLSLTLGIVFVWSAAFLGDASALWDLFELPGTLPMPPIWATWLSFGCALVLLCVLGDSLYSIHRVLKHTPSNGFYRIASLLRRCAIGLLSFWFGQFALGVIVPMLLLSEIPVGDWPELDLIAIDIEIVFLAFAVALLAVSRELERAQDIEDENKQFL